MIDSLGILGVGHLASYVVAGLINGGYQGVILLSPRNYQQSQDLARQYHCEIAASNEALVSRSTTLLLAVRPAQLEDLLQSLTFRPEQLLISCVAGISVADMSVWAAPAQVVRTLPLVSAEIGEGALPLFPAHPVAQELLQRLGQVVPCLDEKMFELASVAGCMNGWVYAFLNELIRWYVEQGMAEEQARDLVLHSVRGAVNLAAAKPDLSLQKLSDSIATEGTFTRMGLQLLQDKGGLSAWLQASDRVAEALRHTPVERLVSESFDCRLD